MNPDKFVETTISLRCGNICGRWYGNLHERPILALHGWGDNAGTFSLLAPILAKHIPILAIDYPGHGLSASNAPGIKYSVLGYVRMVREIMLYYKWTKISLLGHSLGTGLSYLIACLFPGSVDILICIDGFGVPQYKIVDQVKALHSSAEGFCEENEKMMSMEKLNMQPTLYSHQQLENLIYKATGKSVHLENAKYLLERKIKSAVNEENKLYLTGDRRVKYMDLFLQSDCLQESLTQRVEGAKILVIKSESSPFIKLKQFLSLAELLHHKNPLIEFYMLPNTTHHLHLNNVELVAGFIEPFVKNNRKSEPLHIEGKL